MPLRTDEVLQDEPNPGPSVALARELYPLIIDALRPACLEQLTRGISRCCPMVPGGSAASGVSSRVQPITAHSGHSGRHRLPRVLRGGGLWAGALALDDHRCVRAGWDHGFGVVSCLGAGAAEP